MSLNKIFLQGRIVNDIELRHTQSGVSTCNFRIAVDRDFKSKSGEKETDFVTIVAWRNTADFINSYFAKGRMIVVEGRLQVRNYNDRDGNKRTATEVVAENAYFGDSKKEEPSNTGFGSLPHRDEEPEQFSDLDEDDGELPF